MKPIITLWFSWLMALGVALLIIWSEVKDSRFDPFKETAYTETTPANNSYDTEFFSVDINGLVNGFRSPLHVIQKE